MWLLFESSISFLEMLTSCYFAFRIFGKRFENEKEILYLLLFSFLGTMLLTMRELGILSYPDFIPSLVTVGLYTRFRCKAKWWIVVGTCELFADWCGDDCYQYHYQNSSGCSDGGYIDICQL